MAPFRPSQRVHRALHSSLLFFTAMAILGVGFALRDWVVQTFDADTARVLTSHWVWLGLGVSLAFATAWVFGRVVLAACGECGGRSRARRTPGGTAPASYECLDCGRTTTFRLIEAT